MAELHIDLSNIKQHPWPACFSAAVSKILDNANIPNFIWGDLLNRWRGNAHLPQICGFVVPTELLDNAVSAIEKHRLPLCPCTSTSHHADPSSDVWLPKHFVIPLGFGIKQYLFLCPSDALLDLLPLTPSHPNPASLEYDLFRVSLRNRFTPFEIYKPGEQLPLHSDNLDDTHPLKVLTASSLVKALILLMIFSPPERQGVDWEYCQMLSFLRVDMDREEQQLHFGSQSIQRLWDRYSLGDSRLKRMLENEVYAEWSVSMGRENSRTTSI
ncbi:hypothetical protein VKT23_006787 [Stygiomarasmius scandens]|uniref:Uncharacterized protein n=1 Tax=Marasmiellus scandens TaxID=2682957 RepID=A0ABR1JRF0_9AGAR